jgi:hypothetical protein
MYVAAATASRAVEEAAPVPAKRARSTNTPGTFDLFISARLSVDHRSAPACPFGPFVSRDLEQGIELYRARGEVSNLARERFDF